MVTFLFWAYKLSKGAQYASTSKLLFFVILYYGNLTLCIRTLDLYKSRCAVPLCWTFLHGLVLLLPSCRTGDRLHHTMASLKENLQLEEPLLKVSFFYVQIY
jgi:hypothetical protein